MPRQVPDVLSYEELVKRPGPIADGFLFQNPREEDVEGRTKFTPMNVSGLLQNVFKKEGEK